MADPVVRQDLVQSIPHPSGTGLRWENSLLIGIAVALLIGGGIAWSFAERMDGRGAAIETGVDTVHTAVTQINTDLHAIEHRLESIEQLLLDGTSGSMPRSTTPLPSGAPMITYRVRPGDTLWHISESLLGSPEYYHVLVEANGLSSPALIRPGERLVIPLPEPAAIAIGAHQD